MAEEKEARLRLFVAASVPPDRLRKVADAIEPLKARWPGARWTDAANQHITLKFLGWASADTLAAIERACRSVAAEHAPSEVALGHLDAFPTRRRVRVLWFALADPAGVLASVARALDSALEPLGFESEKREFTPHLTLARMKTPVRVVEPWPDARAEADPWIVDGVTLWRSHLSPKGARYEALSTFPLGAGRS